MNAAIAYGRRPRSLSDGEIQEIGRLFSNHMPICRIARLFGIDPTTINKSLLWSGHKAAINRCIRFAPEEYPKILEMYKQGMTITAIANAFNVSVGNHGRRLRPMEST